MSVKSVLLHQIAHGRAGDKGNRANISVIPFDKQLYPYLVEQVTEDAVLGLFQHKGATRVTRYTLPNLHALNFVIDDVLEGGVNDGLCIDGHGKTLSFLLLGGLRVELPIDLASAITNK